MYGVMLDVHVDAIAKWAGATQYFVEMFRAAKISSSSSKLPAKPLICVKLRLDLALPEDGLYEVPSSVLLKEYSSFLKVCNRL